MSSLINSMKQIDWIEWINRIDTDASGYISLISKGK